MYVIIKIVKEISVKNYYSVGKERRSLTQIANLVENETIIFFTKQNEYSLIVYQNNLDSVKWCSIKSNQLNFALKVGVESFLKYYKMPVNHSFMKTNYNTSNVFVSDYDSYGFDIALMKDGKKINWEIVPDKFHKSGEQIIYLRNEEKTI